MNKLATTFAAILLAAPAQCSNTPEPPGPKTCHIQWHSPAAGLAETEITGNVLISTTVTCTVSPADEQINAHFEVKGPNAKTYRPVASTADPADLAHAQCYRTPVPGVPLPCNLSHEWCITGWQIRAEVNLTFHESSDGTLVHIPIGPFYHRVAKCPGGAP